jgi:hypothetical protein
MDHYGIGLGIYRNEYGGLAFLYSLPLIGVTQALGDFWKRVGELQKELQAIRNAQGKKVVTNRLEGGRQSRHGVAHG